VAPRPHLVAMFSCPEASAKGVIDFLIDTGADQTVIMPDDLARLGIAGKHLIEGCPSETLGVGGIPVPLRYLRGVSMEFQTDGGATAAPIEFEQVAVLFPRRADRRGNSYKGMPSLLGRSFLSLCHIDLSVSGVLLHYEG